MSISFNNLRACASSTIPGGGQQPGMWYVLASGPTYTARSLTGTSDLFTDTAVVGDYLLLRIGYGSSKTAGYQFTVGTAITAAAVTVVWEYRLSDGTWAALPGVVDNTNNFTTTGTNSVTWGCPDDWGTNATAVNAYTGAMWCRARLSVATTLTEGGRLTAASSFYDYAVKVDSGHEYDSGTATSGTTTVLNDTGKAWTVNGLINRIVYIHTGTDAGEYRVVNSNTATSMTFLEPFLTALDNTSQYTILANFEDLYQADLSAGWGVITKIGSRSYAINAWLVFDAASFGDVGVSVEFPNNFFWYCKEAATNRNPLIFGVRLPAKYGLDKAIMGNRFTSIRTTSMDNRTLGFNASTEYAFSSGNTYTLWPEMGVVSASNFIRGWFSNSLKYSISDTFEGWRSVVYAKVSPKPEIRRLTVMHGYSGIEQAFAAFDGVRSIYNSALGLYLTDVNNIILPGAEVTFNNPISSVYANAVSYYAGRANYYIIDYQGVRFRHIADSYSSTPHTFKTYIQNTIRARVSDEYGNLLPSAKIQISDSFVQNKKTYLDFDGLTGLGQDDYVSAPNDETGNQLYGSTSFSVETWIYSKGVGESTGRLFDKGSAASLGYALWNSTNNFTSAIYLNTGQKIAGTVTVISHCWKHVVMVWDGSVIRTYVDTVSGGTAAAVGTPLDDSGEALFIGNRNGQDRTLDGMIRRVRLFKNKALSLAEVRTLWDEGRYTQNQSCPVSGCTGEYNFTEGTGTTLSDTVGGVTATLGATTAAPAWRDTTNGMTANSITTTTGTLGEFLLSEYMVAGATASLTTQPASATRLRVSVAKFTDMSSAGSYIQITGTDANGFATQDAILLENIGTAEYFTKKEFLTVDANGVYVAGCYVEVTIDALGIMPVQTVNVETFRTADEVSLLLTEYNPIVIKVSRPGFDPVTIKKNIYEAQDLNIALKRSVLDIK